MMTFQNITPHVQFGASLCGALFTGASLYIHFAALPVVNEISPAKAKLNAWKVLYERSAPIQASLAGISSICAQLAFYLSKEKAWFIGGLFVGSVIPYTVLIMAPLTNNKLFEFEVEEGSKESQEKLDSLLSLWNKMHAVRSIASLAGFSTMLFHLITKKVE